MMNPGMPPIPPRKPRESERPFCPKCKVGRMTPTTESWEPDSRAPSQYEIMFYAWRCGYCGYKVRI